MSILETLTIKLKRLIYRLRGERLVLTILVKDELDIIIDNIFYHYAQGVDKVIVTDNGSTDGTLEVLKSMHEQGIVHLLQEKDYQQTKWVNNMGVEARDRFGATIIIHTDADEFWHPINQQSLKEAFLQKNKRALLVERYNILPDRESASKEFPQQHMNKIKKRLTTDNLQEASKATSLYLFKQSPKVMFSVRDKMRLVKKGNHQLADESVKEVTDNIEIFHFPFKSSPRFTEKVVRAADSIKVDEISRNKNVSWHWKRWRKKLESGKLQNEIEFLIPNLSKVKGIESEKFNYRNNIISSIRDDKDLKVVYKKYTEMAHSLTKSMRSNA